MKYASQKQLPLYSQENSGQVIDFPESPRQIFISEQEFLGSPYKTMQVREYRSVLLCKHLIFRNVLPEAMICNLLKLLTRIVL